MSPIDRLIMYFNNSWNKSKVSWEHYKNTKDLASTIMQSYWLGLEGEKLKIKITKRLGTFVRNPNFYTIAYYAFGKVMQGNKMVFNYFKRIVPLQYMHMFIWYLTCTFYSHFNHFIHPWIHIYVSQMTLPTSS